MPSRFTNYNSYFAMKTSRLAFIVTPIFIGGGGSKLKKKTELRGL
jgi:hypothetical protein